MVSTVYGAMYIHRQNPILGITVMTLHNIL